MKTYDDIFGHTIFISDKTASEYEYVHKMPLDRDIVSIYTAIAEERNPGETDDSVISDMTEELIRNEFDNIFFITGSI